MISWRSLIFSRTRLWRTLICSPISALPSFSSCGFGYHYSSARRLHQRARVKIAVWINEAFPFVGKRITAEERKHQRLEMIEGFLLAFWVSVFWH
ncbi:Protein of unknown function [Pyronema omphalodes CBS 100304]|uniref:Uncharacterized protein n=1 Tax=Pyronema omphalodes (strain CBS 100304) TaxID=1076935 RepID=U4KYS7_PYROM|nr:Protein of unknown function [Pyronema omphalodes CBS 100304]